ncbi:hypothetical protein P154DRAFT_570466 [Amniculicola lignicola CBS 123094]|uniref:Uncharacterized protein n=1 Tax=Amniculicola lignicola CBS 123094 TaxID=1392246 RepID=A0A6A5WXD8_9PLEO|nr:hypothetical protein P154DRAFT_570466 [Amniculicola lignicola CBS 123094]
MNRPLFKNGNSIDGSWTKSKAYDSIGKTVEGLSPQRLGMVQGLRQSVLSYESVLDPWRLDFARLCPLYSEQNEWASGLSSKCLVMLGIARRQPLDRENTLMKTLLLLAGKMVALTDRELVLPAGFVVRAAQVRSATRISPCSLAWVIQMMVVLTIPTTNSILYFIVQAAPVPNQAFHMKGPMDDPSIDGARVGRPSNKMAAMKTKGNIEEGGHLSEEGPDIDGESPPRA